MNAFWSYFWPMFAIGLALGLVGGVVGFPKRRTKLLLASVGIALAAGMLWHGPIGAANRFSERVERHARLTLDYLEMTQVQASLHHGPLTRRLILTGPADDFQRSELVRIMSDIPGVSSAAWSGSGGLPLLVEGMTVTAVGFLAGLLLAYLIELRRRHNAQWKW